MKKNEAVVWESPRMIDEQQRHLVGYLDGLGSCIQLEFGSHLQRVKELC